MVGIPPPSGALGARPRSGPQEQTGQAHRRPLPRLAENLAAETEAHGISVFALHPGPVRTAMWESLFLSDEAKKYLPDMYDYVSQGGSGVPPKRAAKLVLFLASGQVDALSGRFISVDDDVAEMVQRAEEIQQGGLHTLRLRTCPASG